jgi:hypothetical protein
VDDTGCDGVEGGGPAWLFPFVLSAGIVAIWAGVLLLVLQRDARLGRFERLGPNGQRHWAPGAVAAVGAVVFISVTLEGPGEPWITLVETGIPAAAAAMAIASARSQTVGVPVGYPLPWRAVQGPARWSLLVVASLGILPAICATIAMFALGHPRYSAG